MKTLSKEITRQFFLNGQEGYDEMVRRWAQLVNSPEKKNLTVGNHVVYAILRGKDWTKAVPRITNEVKLANGGYYDSGYYNVTNNLHDRYSGFLLFQDLLALDAPKRIRALLACHPSYSGVDLDPYKEIV